MRSLARRLLTCEFFGVELFPLANYQATIRASQLRISLRSGRVVTPALFTSLFASLRTLHGLIGNIGSSTRVIVTAQNPGLIYVE